MRYGAFLVSALFGVSVIAFPAPTTEQPPYPTDCAPPHCGGECGDGEVQTPYEECDKGPLNGQPGSGCSKDCKCVPIGYCGDGHVDTDLGELCDLGKDLNGAYGTNCSSECQPCEPPKPPGRCGDKTVDTDLGEECDLGDGVNGSPGATCDAHCKKCEPPKPPGRCGDKNVDTDLGEECDLGDGVNGSPGATCDAHCKKCEPPKPPGRCGDKNVDTDLGEECDLGDGVNGTPGASCDAHCKKCDGNPVTPPGSCPVCDPNPFFNKCTTSTSCIVTQPSGKDYCACRAGYRADGLSPTDPKQFRLNFPGQLYRVFVAPGVECNTLCTTPFPGPDSCKEVPVQSC